MTHPTRHRPPHHGKTLQGKMYARGVQIHDLLEHAHKHGIVLTPEDVEACLDTYRPLWLRVVSAAAPSAEDGAA